MSYDPRRGESAYLGMDVDDYDDDDLPETDADSTYATSSQPRYRGDADDTLYRTGTDISARQSSVDDTMYREGTQAQRDADVPRTLLRPARAARPSAARGDTSVLQGTAARTPLNRQTASRDARRAVPSPAQQRYEPDARTAAGSRHPRARKALSRMQSFALFLLALLLRAAALLLAVLVVASAFLTGSARATLITALNLTPLLVPPSLLGQFVVETPFGGVLRGDLAIASFLLFIADYVCVRFSASLKWDRERSY